MAQGLERSGLVMVFGAWDDLGPSDVEFLERARTFGTRLAVGVLANDLCGAKHPLAARMVVLSALRAVDQVVPVWSADFDSYLEAHEAGVVVVSLVDAALDGYKKALAYAEIEGLLAVVLPGLPL